MWPLPMRLVPLSTSPPRAVPEEFLLLGCSVRGGAACNMRNAHIVGDDTMTLSACCALGAQECRTFLARCSNWRAGA